MGGAPGSGTLLQPHAQPRCPHLCPAIRRRGCRPLSLLSPSLTPEQGSEGPPHRSLTGEAQEGRGATVPAHPVPPVGVPAGGTRLPPSGRGHGPSTCSLCGPQGLASSASPSGLRCRLPPQRSPRPLAKPGATPLLPETFTVSATSFRSLVICLLPGSCTGHQVSLEGWGPAHARVSSASQGLLDVQRSPWHPGVSSTEGSSQ